MKRGSMLIITSSSILVILMLLLIFFTGTQYEELKNELAQRQMFILNQRSNQPLE